MKIFPGQPLVACLLAAAPVMAQSIPVTERTLANGMRVLLVERHNEPGISAGWVARVGSANEHAGMTGMAHLFEHMMFKGTSTIGTKDARRDQELNDAQDRVQAQIRKELDILREKQRRGEIADMMGPEARTPRLQELLGAFDALVKEQRALGVKDELNQIYTQEGARNLNANTNSDRTFFYIDVPANKLELWAWLESDRLKNAVFREFYSERDVVQEERRQTTEATPEGPAMEAFQAMVWKAHPYAWPVIGLVSDISQVTREQASQFFRTYYAPNNLTAILVGDFQTDEALRMMERYFGRIPANPVEAPPVVTLDSPQLGEQRMTLSLEAEPVAIAFYKTVPSVHKDAPALRLLSGVLNGGSGRLKKELVLRQKAAVSAQSGLNSMKFGGTFYFEVVPAEDRRPEDLEPAIYAEIEKIALHGVTGQELLKVKNRVRIQAFQRQESNGGILNLLAGAEGDGTYRDLLEEADRLQAVTAEDIQRVARTYFVPENRSVLMIHRKEAGAEEAMAPTQETQVPKEGK